MEEMMERKNKITGIMLGFTILAILITVVDRLTDMFTFVIYNTLGMFEITWTGWLFVMIVLIVIREKVKINDERKQPPRNHIDFE